MFRASYQALQSNFDGVIESICNFISNNKVLNTRPEVTSDAAEPSTLSASAAAAYIDIVQHADSHPQTLIQDGVGNQSKMDVVANCLHDSTYSCKLINHPKIDQIMEAAASIKVHSELLDLCEQPGFVDNFIAAIEDKASQLSFNSEDAYLIAALEVISNLTSTEETSRNINGSSNNNHFFQDVIAHLRSNSSFSLSEIDQIESTLNAEATINDAHGLTGRTFERHYLELLANKLNLSLSVQDLDNGNSFEISSDNSFSILELIVNRHSHHINEYSVNPHNKADSSLTNLIDYSLTQASDFAQSSLSTISSENLLLGGACVVGVSAFLVETNTGSILIDSTQIKILTDYFISLDYVWTVNSFPDK